jgi:aerobic-type carbon monoxide dehydrogenase small subunit (CoxS/CutS family)
VATAELAKFELTINGQKRPVDAAPSETLLSVLRDRLDLTGAKYGCGEGQCGACTVLLGAQAVRSCQVPVSSVKDKPVTTIEGFAKGGQLHRLQQAFLDEGAFQCGFCTPGMILAAAALLAKVPHPNDAEIRREMNGNICRCGTYPRIIAAIRRAAQEERHG